MGSARGVGMGDKPALSLEAPLLLQRQQGSTPFLRQFKRRTGEQDEL